MKNKRRIAIITTSIIFCVVALAIIFVKALPIVVENLIEYCNKTEEEYYTDKVEEYGKWNGHIESEKEEREGKSGLKIFPKKKADLNVKEYIYSCREPALNSRTYLIYAKVKYSNEEYKNEIERLSKLKCKIAIDGNKSIVEKKVEYSDNLFKYPAYITIYASNLCYEYALLDEKNSEIVYVFTRLADANGIIENRYLPMEVIGKDMYKKNSWDNHNMYWAEDSDGNHVSYDF